MKKKFIFFCSIIAFLTVVPTVLSAQELIPFNENQYRDSLEKSVQSGSNIEEKVNSWLLLSNFYRSKDSLISRKYLDQAKKNLNSEAFLQGKFYFYEGQYFADKDKERAADSFSKSIEKLKTLSTKEADLMQSSAWYNYSLAKKDSEGYPFVIKNMLEKAIPLAEKHGDQRKIGHLYSQLGIIFTYNAEFQKAENYLLKAKNILSKYSPASVEMFYNQINLVMNYCYLAQGDAAKKELDLASEIISKHPESSVKSTLYYGETLYNITKQQLPQALLSINSGISSARKYNQNFLLQMFFFNKYDVLQKMGKFAEAKQILLDILKEKTLVADANNRKTVYQQLALISEKMGNKDDALLWMKNYSTLSDSIYTKNMQLEINKIEAKYNAAEKEKLLAQTQLDINKKNKYMWIFGLASLLFLSYGLFVYFSSRSRKKLAAQREINLMQQLTETRQREQLQVTKAILDGEERERERVAKDLHDGLGGMLAGVKINLSTWSSNNLESEQVQDFHKILNQLDNSVSELRRVARNLMPESLLNFGLEVALKDLCEFYSREELHIDFQPLNIDTDIPLNTQINIYRIIQELLANAVKHAGANNILLQCSQSEQQFFITIEDNGKGIKKEDHLKLKSMGLKNLQNRVNYLNGKMEIQSETNEGTCINIELNTHAVA